MDDRKKQIDELEKKKRDNTALLDGMLVRLGESLFARIPDSLAEVSSPESLPDEMKTYRQLQNDIEGSEASIEVIEEQMRKLKELEETVTAMEQEEKACSKDLSGMYNKLGKMLLDSSEESAVHFCTAYRSQADALLTKVHSLEDRIAGLEQKEGGNVFTWIGNSAQTMVLRSFLTKSLENLMSLRRNLGERFIRPGEELREDISPEITGLCGDTEQKRAELKALSHDLTALREEKMLLSAGFSADGNPARKIQTLKKHITNVREELKTLYRHVGAGVSGSAVFAATSVPGLTFSPCVEGSECGLFFNSLVIPEDREIMDKAYKISLSIENDEKAVSRLRASLAIDEERAKIEKYRRMILEKREKIAQAEKNIAEYEEGITDCESHIEKLQEITCR